MCHLYEWLYALIPLRRVRGRLLRSHFETCPRCRKTIASSAELETAAEPPAWIAAEESLWPVVRERIQAGPLPGNAPPAVAPGRFSPRLRWALSATFAGAMLIAAGIFLFRPAFAPRDRSRVSVVRAEADGQKARTFFYQTREASYVWVTKPEKNSGE